MRAIAFTLCALSLSLLPETLTAQQNLIVDGSFESPVISGTNLNFSGFYSFDGWNGYSMGNGVTSASGIVGGTLGPPPFDKELDGNQAFSLNGGNPPPGSYIEQSFAATVGQQYMLSFGVYRFNDQSVPVQLDAQIFDQSDNAIIDITAVPQPNVGWLTVSDVFTADDTLLRLRFTDTSPSNPNTDLLLDAVSVVPAPEPFSATVAALGLSVAALLKTKRWRRRLDATSCLVESSPK